MNQLLNSVLIIMAAVAVSFAQTQFIDSGQHPGQDGYGCTIADLNNDGNPDIYIANADLGPDQVWFNNGKGVFSNSGQNIGIAVKRDRSIALADFNGDSFIDVFIANDQVGNPTGCPNEVWINDGTGKFSDSGQRLGNLASAEVALGDIDNDGDKDAVIANLHDLNGNNQPNEIWLNDGKAVFTNSGQWLGNSCSYTAAISDIDGDGDPDIYTANGFFNKIEPDDIWLNQGGKQNGTPGIFKNSGILFPQTRSWEVRLGDLDNDGDPDVLVTNGWGKHEDNKIYFNVRDTSSTGIDNKSD